jgi:hypothetical protein
MPKTVGPIRPSTPRSVDNAVDTPPIKRRAVYGYFARNEIVKIKNSLKDTIALVNYGIKNNEFNALELKDAKRALGDLKDAVRLLEVPGGKIPKGEQDERLSPIFRRGVPAARPGGPRLAYGIRIRDYLATIRQAIEGTLAVVDQAIKGKTIKGTDLIDAKQARVELRNALQHVAAVAAPKRN